MPRYYRELVRMKCIEVLSGDDFLPSVRKHVAGAFAGDLEAVDRVYVALENEWRGIIAVRMWEAGVPNPAFGRFLSNTWEHEHRHLIKAAQNRRRLAAMFRYAQFPRPAGVPGRITVWRGTSKLTRHQAARGYSWTRSRDIACWFAMRFAESNGRPLVLRAEIDAADVALFHDGRDEAEAVLTKPPATVTVDGGPEDWAEAGARHEAEKNARQLADLRATTPHTS